jgi:anti-sigma factor RsiW
MAVVTLTTVRFGRDHRFTAGHLSDYSDGGLAARGRERIERHIPDCPECEQALRSLERLLVRLHGLPALSEAQRPGIAAAVRRRLREPTPS